MPLAEFLNPRDLLRAAFLTVATLLPIINPIGSAAIFLTFVQNYSHETQRALSRKIATNSFFLIVGSVLIGTYVLRFFGLSLGAVQIAGGMILIASGRELLNQTDASQKDKTPVTETGIMTQAFYPLTLPVTVGPGAISVAIALGATIPKQLEEHSLLMPAVLIGVLLGALASCYSVYLCYTSADRLGKAIGSTGTTIVMRLSAFILLCIGVQIGWNGIQSLLGPLLRR